MISNHIHKDSCLRRAENRQRGCGTGNAKANIASKVGIGNNFVNSEMIAII